ncbi:MAG: S-layer homology domain-containing protein [Eubacteriales bacterium]|jgi:uncharacterized repeat protein (TIGR02543 family)
MKKLLSWVLSLTLVLGSLQMSVSAASYNDVSGHWGETAINYWSQYNVVGGRVDGSFDPDGLMTRGEFAQVMANLLPLEEKADLSQYTDIKGNEWFVPAMEKCVAAGVFSGTSDTTLSPDSNITREEVFVILARIFGLAPQAQANTTFSDSDQISDWAVKQTNAIINQGWVNGIGDNQLWPRANINRASVMQLLMNSIDLYVQKTNTTVTAKEGQFVLVAADGTVINGKADTVVVYGNVTIKGDVKEIIVMAPDAKVTVEGKADQITVNETADSADITVPSYGEVDEIITNASDVTIKGNGKVRSVDANGDNTVVETDGTKVTASEDATGTMAGDEKVPAGESAVVDNSQGSSSSSGSSSGSTYYSVTFTNGTESTSVRVRKGKTVEKPTDPVKEGYTFAGWFDGETLFDFTTPITGSLTLTAKWVENPEPEVPATVYIGDKGYTSLEAALTDLNAATQDVTITLLKDQALTQEMVFTNANDITITVDGGNNTISSNGISGDKLINVIGANVTLKNLTLDNAGTAKGLQVYNNNKSSAADNWVILENVTIKNSAGNGITVNGSKVKATNLTIEGSAWGQSIDVSQGVGVTTPSELILDKTDGLKDAFTIIEDNKTTASVTIGDAANCGARGVAMFEKKSGTFYTKYEYTATAKTNVDFVVPGIFGSAEANGNALSYILSVASAGARIQLDEGTYQAPQVNGTSAFALAHPVSLIGAGEDATTINGHIFINFNGGIGQSQYPDGSAYPITFSDFTLVDDKVDAEVGINTGSVNFTRENYDFTVKNVTFKDFLFGVQLASGYQNNTMAMENVHFESVWCAASMRDTNELTMNDCTFDSVTYQYQTWGGDTDKAGYYKVFNDPSTIDHGAVKPGVGDWESTEASYTNEAGQQVTGTFADAIANAQANSTVKLIRDVELTAPLSGFADGLTIDGAGKIITTTANYGINVPVDTTALTLTDLTLKKADKSGSAIKIPSSTDAMTLTLTDCNVEGFEFGIYRDIPKDTAANTTVNITGGMFKDNYQKAIYIEAMSNSTITGCQFINCGTRATGAASNMATAVDINLKYGDYENITIENCYFKGNGAGLGGALLIKARDDAPSYSTKPATLTGVSITGCTFVDNNRDIVFGEPMKNNQGPTGVTIDGQAVEPSTTTLPGVSTIGGAEVIDYRVPTGKAGVSFAGNTTGVVVDNPSNFEVELTPEKFEDVTDFFCADCVAKPGTDHATHTSFAEVKEDGSLEMEKAEDGRLPYFQLDNVDLANVTYTISYDLTVNFTGESDGVLSVNTGNTNYASDAHFVLKQGEGLYNFAGNTLISDDAAFRSSGTYTVTVTYTLDGGTPKTELTIAPKGNASLQQPITGKGGADKKGIYWCGYTYENVTATISNFTVSAK